VQEERIPGAVALVLRNGKPVYERAFGWSDKEAGRRMTTDTVFRIASQTKALTSAAILLLVEEGAVGITEPVWHFIPTFKDTTVQCARALRSIPSLRSVPSLFTTSSHTRPVSPMEPTPTLQSFMKRKDSDRRGNGWYTADKDEPICETMQRLGTLPFVSQPGEAYVYGYNTDILGMRR
jgi:CubicO group peptidase (beta-lactamase class C family)